MTKIHIQKKTFLKKFQKLSSRFIKKLNDYITNPEKKNIHDIRILIRRLEAAYRILPGKLRRDKKIQIYVAQAKALFKINTQIRDFDIICGKLEEKNPNLFSEIISNLAHQREINVLEGHKLALKLKTLKPLMIAEDDISESKIRKRIKKIINELNFDIWENVPIVLSDDKKVEELHKLRKDFKKFRYTIESTVNKTKQLRILRDLRTIQDELGAIHDNDIVLNFIRNSKIPIELTDIIRQEILEREQKYQKFVAIFKKKKFNKVNLNLQF